jgi:hypothetical protein
MRFRLEANLADAVERLARAENRTTQNMTAKLLTAGLAAQGHPVQVPMKGNRELHIPLPSAAFREIKKLAAAEVLSNRTMTRAVILAGLESYGVWPPAADAAA